MSGIKSFGIIGGDKRLLYCAASLALEGYSVYLCGFDKCSNTMGLELQSLSYAAEHCDAFILPLPCTRDGSFINAPFSSETIAIDSELINSLGNKPVFCGMKSRLPFCRDMIYDYSEREEFAVENAVPTGEGAIEIAMREYEGTIHSSSCLVTGYGRIGKVLSEQLKGLGADVTVSARKTGDLALIHSRGMKAIRSDRLSGEYDLIFNTVPHLLFDAHTLARVAAKSIVIDLASLPGGVDTDAARRMSIKTIHALSLPGKAAPKISGMIIKNAVYNIIEEEQL